MLRLEIVDRPGLWTTTDIAISAIGLVVLLIWVYRALGLPLVVIASLFILFTFFVGYSEWARHLTNCGGTSLSKAPGHDWMQTEDVFGVALGVSTSMIFPFVLAWNLMVSTGHLDRLSPALSAFWPPSRWSASR